VIARRRQDIEFCANFSHFWIDQGGKDDDSKSSSSSSSSASSSSSSSNSGTHFVLFYFISLYYISFYFMLFILFYFICYFHCSLTCFSGYKIIDVDASATIQEIASVCWGEIWVDFNHAFPFAGILNSSKAKFSQNTWFLQDNGITIPRGGAFYLLENKSESVSAGKKVVVVHKKTGEQKVDAEARKAIKMGAGAVKVKASQFPDWEVFIQTTSFNRVVKAPSKYESFLVLRSNRLIRIMIEDDGSGNAKVGRPSCQPFFFSSLDAQFVSDFLSCTFLFTNFVVVAIQSGFAWSRNFLWQEQSHRRQRQEERR